VRLPTQLFAGTRPERAKLKPVTNGVDGGRQIFWKPTGGLWTSTYTPDDEHPSNWVEWSTLEQFAVDKYAERWLLEPDDCRVAHVVTQDDLADLLATYRLEVPKLEGLGLSFEKSLLDFEALAEDFDALTFPAPWAERFTGDHGLAIFFSVLDSECSLWFRWCFHGHPRRLEKAAA
jgi:hypothetical protein